MDLVDDVDDGTVPVFDEGHDLVHELDGSRLARDPGDLLVELVDVLEGQVAAAEFPLEVGVFVRDTDAPLGDDDVHGLAGGGDGGDGIPHHRQPTADGRGHDDG